MTMDWTRPRRALRRGGAWLALAGAALLAACGGGSEPIEPFAPTRMFSLGDEISVLTNVDPKGRKYTVNGLDDNGQISCALNVGTTGSLIWTQQMALAYAFVFEECNPLSLTVSAWTFAVPGAKSADFVAQYAAAQARFGPLGPRDVMTVLFGANDVLDDVLPRFLANPTTDNGNALVAELRQRGVTLANELNAIMTNCGPKLIVSTMPLVNLTPYALQLQRNNPSVPIFSWLQQFSNSFNSGLRTTMINDGALWGLVELDALLSAGVSNPGNYGLVNVTQAACDPAKALLPNCTTDTLVSNANAATWLWASDRWMSWRAHQYLGSFARGRVTDNPFSNGCPVSS
jgi:phospholipase/lecithinase/hemolysin